MTETHRKERVSGLINALLAYGWWGIIPPLYFTELAHVPAFEVLAHRIVWSIFLLLGWLFLTQRFADLAKSLRNPSLMGLYLLTTTLVGLNWLVYIYSVSSKQVVQSSLGYFINPLVNVVLGVLFFKETLRGVQWSAVALAAAGVCLLTIGSGQLPWIALTLAFSFALYGMIRKTIHVDGVVSLTVEVLLLLPLSTGFVIFLMANGKSSFATTDRLTDVLLMAGAIVTVLPLVWFGQAARKLPLSTLGFIQYLAPTLQFLVAVLWLKEELDMLKFISFVLIWIGLAIYSVDSVFAYHQYRSEQKQLSSTVCQSVDG